MDNVFFFLPSFPSSPTVQITSGTRQYKIQELTYQIRLSVYILIHKALIITLKKKKILPTITQVILLFETLRNRIVQNYLYIIKN